MSDETSQPEQWPDPGEAPDRADVLAAQELADVRRVLAIDVTRRTISPCHEWVLRVGEMPVRIEIAQGASLEEVDRALVWVREILRQKWAYAANPIGAMAIAMAFERADLSRGTIDGKIAVSEGCFLPVEKDASNAG